MNLGGQTGIAIAIDVDEFCLNMTNSARRWLNENGSTPQVEKNLERFIRRYPNGLSPWFVGMPVLRMIHRPPCGPLVA